MDNSIYLTTGIMSVTDLNGQDILLTCTIVLVILTNG